MLPWILKWWPGHAAPVGRRAFGETVASPTSTRSPAGGGPARLDGTSEAPWPRHRGDSDRRGDPEAVCRPRARAAPHDQGRPSSTQVSTGVPSRSARSPWAAQACGGEVARGEGGPRAGSGRSHRCGVLPHRGRLAQVAPRPPRDALGGTSTQMRAKYQPSPAACTRHTGKRCVTGQRLANRSVLPGRSASRTDARTPHEEDWWRAEPASRRFGEQQGHVRVVTGPLGLVGVAQAGGFVQRPAAHIGGTAQVTGRPPLVSAAYSCYGRTHLAEPEPAGVRRVASGA